MVFGVRPERLAAQGIITGGIIGSVVDPTGAVIPNADITAVNESTGSSFRGKTTADGTFTVSNVPIGHYTVTITATGFGVDKVTHVYVVAGNASSLAKQVLQLGSSSETVEVQSNTSAVLNTESPQSETTIDTQQVESAPVTGAMDNLAMMVPGVVNTHSDGMSNTNGANFSVNGQRGRSNNSEIDGQTNNDTSIGGPSFFFDNQDAIQEIQVITTNMGAQYGRNLGSVVNYITKNGTNAFHGSAFEIYTGSWLSSLTQYQKDPQFSFCPPGQYASCSNPNSPNYGLPIPTVPRFVQNNWGGTFGGPILKDRLWFFGSTLWDHTYESGVVDTSGGALFPDPTGLSTLQSVYPNNPGVAALVANGPYSSSLGDPKPVAVPSSTCSAAGGTPTTNGFCDVPVTNGTTSTTVETGQYQRTFPDQILDQEHLGRLDYQMTSSDRFYVRYNYQNNPYNPAFYLVSAETAAGGGYPNVKGITHEVGGEWTHTFTPNMTNQLRYAFQQSNLAFESGAVPTCTISNFSSCTSTVSLGGSFSTYGYGGSFPQGRFIKVNQFQDNANWIHGRNSIMFGTEIDYQDSPWGFLPNGPGTFNFAPGATNTAASNALNNGLSGILQGIGQLSLAVGNPTIPFKETDFAFYFQDDWKPTPNLTVNLGVRYEYFGQAVNFLHNESVARQTGSAPFWNTSLPLSATTVPAVDPDRRNVEPRIGLAYIPSFLPRMVIHAGYTINVDPEFYNLFINIATSAPVINSGNFACDGVKVQCLPSGGLTFATVQAQDGKYLPTGIDPRALPTTTVPTNLRNPMGETYSLGFQYEVSPGALAEVRYVGNHTFGQFQALNANPDIQDVRTYFPSYGAGISVCTTPGAPGNTRPNCANSLVLQYGNTAFSIYNALQTSLTVRNFHGWTGTASYTYSRTIDNVSEFASTGAAGTTSALAQNPLDTNEAERGVNGNSYPNVWGIQLTYHEPWFHSQHGLLGRLLGGYFLNTFYQYNGGQPFNPIQNASTVQSGAVAADIKANPNINPTEATNSFCDFGFAQQFGTSCRPILSNPKAPLSSIGINLGPGGYVDYVTGNPTSPSSEHWLWNNQYEAIALNNPFPGVGRNILRGHTFNDVDASLGKNIHITERVGMELMVSCFNVMNRAYYGSPDPNVEDSLFGGFLNDYYAFGTGLQSAAGGGSYPQGLGNRNVQLTGKITF